jgi:hypothetical protein
MDGIGALDEADSAAVAAAAPAAVPETGAMPVEASAADVLAAEEEPPCARIAEWCVLAAAATAAMRCSLLSAARVSTSTGVTAAASAATALHVPLRA